MLKALIFDVDGTLADTEMAHLAAFNRAFKELDMSWHWDVPTYTQLLDRRGRIVADVTINFKSGRRGNNRFK